MDGRFLDALKRYGIAVALAGLALTLRGVLPHPEGVDTYQLPLAAVVLSAWYGGRGPGLLASLICATGVWYWFIPPVQSWEISPEYVTGFSIFVALCLLFTQFSGARRRAEHALRESEERFRTLVQFSFDVYWESDAQHRFTRQEFAERLTDAPPPNSEIGRTRWEIPYLEPNEEAWRKHRAMLDAHLPFRDFELARPTPDGGKRYVSVSGMPVFNESGRFVGYRGVGRHITERKRAEEEHRAHVWFLESMDRVNRAMQGTNDVEQMMGDVLEAVLETFASDRAWLLYPCVPDAPSWRPIMERTRPEFPGAAARGRDLPMTPESADVARVALASSGALPRGGSHEHQPSAEIAAHFGVRSDMLMALRPKGDRPYLFGLHQCSRVRTWTKEEQRLFEEVGHRLTDALGSLIAFRGLRESEARLEAAQRLARVGWWERDYATGHVTLSDEACRIFGVQPLELPQWHGRWLSLIHPEDREKTAAASDLALRGGPRYDVEYRVVRPDGAVRVVRSQGDVTREESGRPVRQFGVMQDVTELREAERRLEAAQRVARVGWWERDYVTGLMRFSDVLAEIYGIEGRDRIIDLAEWMKLTLIHPEDRTKVLEAGEAALRGGPRYDVENRVVHRDGTVRIVHSQGDVTRDESGRPVRFFGVAQDITELRQAEQGLRASEEQYRSIFNAAQDAMVLRDADFRVVDVNHAWVAVTGVSREEALGRDRVLGKDPPEFEALLKAQHLRVLAGESIVLETERTRRDGRRIDLELRCVPVHYQGRPHVLYIGRDITERKRIEAELRARQEMLDLAQKAARAVAFDWYIGARENENRWSPDLEVMYGLEPGTLDRTYQGWKQLVHPDDWPSVKLALKRAHESGDVEAEYRVNHKDGSVHWLQAKGRMSLDTEGRPERMVGFMIDVTDRRHAEEELRASETRFRTFVDHATDGLFLQDEHAAVIDVNRQACESMGYSRDELIGMHPRDFDARLDAASVAQLGKRVGAGETVTFETLHRRKDGSVFPVEVRVRQFQQGKRRLNLSIVRDISERMRAEESLRESEAYLTEAQRLSHTGSWALDVASNRYLYTSEEFDRLFGLDPDGEKPTREAVLERMHPEDRISWKRILEKSVREKLDTTSQYRIVLPDGSIRHIHTIRHPVVNSAGEVVKLVGTSIDITERKRAEEERERLRRLEAELAHANRVNTLGELTTSIVHEVSQPLGAMIASAAAGARWLAADPPEIAEVRSALDNIAADGKRAREVIARIRALAKRQAPRLELLDINRKIHEVLALTEHELRSHDIVLQAQLGEALRRVAGDRVQLQQVLLNLILNAIEAMSGVHDRPRQLTIVSREDAPNAVVVEVRDSGTGLDPEGAERVFEAFYTTKAEGIGIGLSISRSIIEAHGGRLWASSNEPRGAVFRFSLPVAGEEQS